MSEPGLPAGELGDVVPLNRGSQRRLHSVLQWPISMVLGVLGAGLVLVAVGAFRAGTVTLACSAWVALVLRLLLTDDQAGMLVVRRRSVDAWILGVLGTFALILAFWVPVPK